MDYKGLTKLDVAASRMPAGVFGYSGINDCRWLYVGTCPNNDIPDR